MCFFQVKSESVEGESGRDPNSFPHLSFTFLDPKNIKDKKKRSPGNLSLVKAVCSELLLFRCTQFHFIIFDCTSFQY